MSGRISGLELLDHRFADQLTSLLVRLQAEGIPLEVFETVRSPARQMELYAVGRDPARPEYGRTVTRARAYQSSHQFGMGTDLVFRVNGQWTWEEPRPGMWLRMRQLALQLELTPLDFEQPHVELLGFDWRRIPTGPADTAGWMAWLQARVGG